MRLCQFPLFSRPFPILQVNLWLQFSRFGSIVRWGARGEEKMQRILLNHSFRTLIFHWTFCISRCHGSPETTLACMSLLKMKKTKIISRSDQSREKCRRENKLLWECFASSIQSEPRR